MSVISAATGAVTATISVGSGPEGVGVDTSTGTVFVANNGGGTVSVIATPTTTPTIAETFKPASITFGQPRH